MHRSTEARSACVVGLGYIGLPTASLMANSGFRVVGIDSDAAVTSQLQKGLVPIEEPGLRTLAVSALQSGNLVVSARYPAAEIFILAVPTPVTRARGPDLSCVEAAARAVGSAIRKGSLVILESTVPPGTTRDLLTPLLEKESGLTSGADFGVAHCPERVLPGRIISELIRNDRVVGGIDGTSAERAAAVYSRFVEGRIHITDSVTAELTKLMENTYRDVNIALANELSIMASELGVPARRVIELANLHPRVQLHEPGPGVGGHCIGVDPWFLVSRFGEKARLLRVARAVNDDQPGFVVSRVLDLLVGPADPKVCVLGVAYKGNVDDTRESPARPIARLLEQAGVRLSFYDPHVRHFDRDLEGLESALSGSDCALILADHDEFRYLRPDLIGGLMRARRLFDARGCLDPEPWRAAHFTYRSL